MYEMFSDIAWAQWCTATFRSVSSDFEIRDARHYRYVMISSEGSHLVLANPFDIFFCLTFSWQRRGDRSVREDVELCFE